MYNVKFIIFFYKIERNELCFRLTDGIELFFYFSQVDKLSSQILLENFYFFFSTKKSEKKKFTLKQKVALVSLALVDFMCYCSMSIMAPFFPREASVKGMSDTVSGFVFSFYALVMFVSSPVFGKIVSNFTVHISIIH